MTNDPEIKLLHSFCGLAFGATKEDALRLFGEPEEVQDLHDEVLNNNSQVYHYWNQGFSLFFDMQRNYCFSSVEIDNRDTLLFGVKIFSLKEKELIELLKQNKYLLSDTETHSWGEKRVSFDAAGLDCYFENHKMTSLNFGLTDAITSFTFLPN
jgi:hypothetical protein